MRFIKAQRIKWLGHIQGMDQARPTRKLLNWKPMGTRPVGRPRQRWQEDVMEDLKKLKIKNWKETAEDRRTWRDPQTAVVANNDDDDGSKMSFNIHLLLLKITSRNWSPCHVVHCCNCDRRLAVTVQTPNNSGSVSPSLFLVFLPLLLLSVTTFSAV